MENAQYAILRFAKYKGPEISRIEAHNAVSYTHLTLPTICSV